MDYTARQVIGAELEVDERYLWSGRPRQGVTLRGSDVFMIPFSLLWGGFAIFWEYGVLHTINRPAHGAVPAMALVFPLFGIPFVLIGLYMIFGRFLADSWQRAGTYYGVSNERIIIVSGLFRKTVKSLDICLLSDVSFVEHSDGSGTITFGQEPPWSTWYGRGSFFANQSPTPKFEMIEQVASVYRTIRGARAKN